MQRSSHDGSTGPENYQFQAEISMMPNPLRAEDSPQYGQGDAPYDGLAGHSQEVPFSGSYWRGSAKETDPEIASSPVMGTKIPALVQRSPFEPKDV